MKQLPKKFVYILWGPLGWTFYTKKLFIPKEKKGINVVRQSPLVYNLKQIYSKNQCEIHNYSLGLKIF